MDNQFAEQALLTVLLTDGAMSAEVDIDASEFENGSYAQIYRSIQAVIASDEALDAITVAEHMKSTTGRHWMPVLVELVQGVGVASNVQSYVQIIRRAHRARKAAEIGSRLMQDQAKPGAVEEAIRALMEISKEQVNYEHDLRSAVKRAVEEIDQAFRNPGQLIGVSSGIAGIDEFLGGFHPGDLIVIGARPAMGKTAVMLNMMINAGVPIGCVSGEQGVTQVAQRLLAIRGRMSLVAMRNGRLGEEDWPKLEAAARTLLHHPGMYFNDRSAPRIEDIESSARRWKFEHNVRALYVDYLQRIKRDTKKAKHEAVGDNVARLKELARELGIPLVVLAQVSRDVEKRADKRPRMADLSDSSEIEKEADTIMTLYRDEVYHPDTAEKGVMEISIEKNRHGPTGIIPAAWDGRYLAISNLAGERSAA